MTRPPITREDLSRVLAESAGVDREHWFEENGFADDIRDLLINSSRKGFTTILAIAMIEEDDVDPEVMFGNVCATFMLSGFSLGWEAHKQFGGRRG